MLFDDDFFATVADDPVLAILNAISLYFDVLSSGDETIFSEAEYEYALETYALVSSIVDAYEIDVNVGEPVLTGGTQVASRNLTDYLRSISQQYANHFSSKKIDFFKRRFKNLIGTPFIYEFSQGDLHQIQTLLDELKGQIASSNFFEEDHKQRLLKRVERLQSELHKRVSDLDRFWGLVGDAGVAAGKFGNEAAPIVDRIKEVADIVWRTQSRAEELPSNTPSPLLGHDGVVD